MDFIFEFIMDFMAFILEKPLETGTNKSKKILTFLRFLAGLILGVVYGGIFIGILYVGIANNEPIAIGIAFFFLVAAIAFFVKCYRR